MVPVDTILIFAYPNLQATESLTLAGSDDTAAGAAGATNFLPTIRVVRMMRLFRLIKLFRILRASRIFSRMEAAITISYSKYNAAPLPHPHHTSPSPSAHLTSPYHHLVLPM